MSGVAVAGPAEGGRPPPAGAQARAGVHPLVEERPSERPTAPTLPPIFDSSRTDVIELSATALESVRDARRSSSSSVAPSGASSLVSETRRVGEALGAMPRLVLGAMVVRQLAARVAFVALAVLVVARPGDAPGPTAGDDVSRPRPRAPRQREIAREGIAYARTDASSPTVPAGGCTAAGRPRVVSTRAALGPGVDVTVRGDDFGLGFASASAAHGVIVSGPTLRVAERVAVARPRAPRHVLVDAFDAAGSAVASAGDVDVDGIALHVDDGDARTVSHGGATGATAVSAAFDSASASGASSASGAVRFTTSRGWLNAVLVRPSSNAWARAARPLWRVAVGAVVRASARDDGGFAVVVKRGSALSVGLVDDALAPAGPLVAIARPGAMLGTPSLASSGDDAFVAWAERTSGASSYAIKLARVTVGEPPVIRALASGMSPSVTELPDGELLVAYATGGEGAHRVLVQRLARDLEPRGEPVAVSPEAVNAGQPAAAVRADGRGVVAFFAAERGSAALLAAPLACDPGL